jgi:hypothetical protein
MKSRMLVSLLVVCLCAPSALAWGNSGHRIVARLAQENLSDGVEQQVQTILGQQFMSSVATFPDQFRTQQGGSVTAEWHFTDIDKTHADYDAARDCAFDDCVTMRLERMKQLLADKTQRQSTRADALTFLIHFAGDLHQPFHCATGTLANGSSDRGGNGIDVVLEGKSTNLHSAWDSGILGLRGLSDADYVTHLKDDVIGDQQPNDFSGGTTVEWTDEAHDIAVQFYVDDGTTFTDDYITRAGNAIDLQLVRASFRLARLIEEALGQ